MVFRPAMIVSITISSCEEMEFLTSTSECPSAKDGEALYSQQKQDQQLTVAQTMKALLPNSDLN